MMSPFARGNTPRLNAKISSMNLEQHLHRELEAGNITWNDYERTKRFASSSHIFYKATIATGAVSSGWCFYYGLRHRKRPWSWTATLMIAPLAFIAGMIPGICFQTFRIKRFQTGLEDQKSLLKALGKIVRDDKVNEEIEAEDGLMLNDQLEVVQQNRWAKLRKASATVSDSAWDKIRQSHERPGMTSASDAGPESQSESDRPEADNRASEQAKFDALLEAERKMSS